MGVALGLTNLLVRNLTQKGYVRVAQATWNRRLYTLTPDGFSHRIRLLVGYIHRVLDHYQTVRTTLRDELEPLGLNAESRVAIYGSGEFAELVFLGLKDVGIEEMEFFGPTNQAGRKFLGIPLRDVATLQQENYDRVVLATLESSDSLWEDMIHLGVAPDKLVTFFGDGKRKKGD